MPKVSGVVEEVNEEDEKLRKEFVEFGEMINDKITDKNRPLLIKKLNHLRARRRMSEKLSESILKESTKRPAASRRGRGRKGKSVKNEPSHEEMIYDDAVGGDEDQMNETFSVSEASADVEPPAKQSKYMPTVKASEGPYAVGRKKVAAGKSQNATQASDEMLQPSDSGSTVQNDVFTSFGFNQNFLSPATKNDVPKRGRSRTVDNARVNANTVPVNASMASESVDSSNAQKVSLPKKRNMGTSAVPAAAKFTDMSTQEESSALESTSLSVSSMDVKVTLPSAGDRGRGQQHKPGEPSKNLEDAGKLNLTSRIPKLARFPSPPTQQQKSSTSTAVSVPPASATADVVKNIPKVITRVMDTVSGRPAAGMTVKLFSQNQSGTWSHMTDSATDEKGATAELGAGKQWCAGIHRIHYETGLYFRQHGMKTLYPHVDVVFSVVDPKEPVQIELAIGPYGYSTHASVGGSS